MLKRAYIERGEAFGAVQEHFQNGGFKSYADGQACLERIKDIHAADVIPRSNLLLFLALYAPAPENAPDQWFYHGEKNFEAWRCFIEKCEIRGYYSIPMTTEANNENNA